MENILSEYMQSEFYKKYKDTYFSDSILKEIIGEKITKHKFIVRNKNRYEFVYNKMIEVIQDFINGYAEHAEYADGSIKWKMLYAMYIDSDFYSVRERDGIVCTADALLSIRRMYQKHGLSLELAEEYKNFRKTPIFHFPTETNGINQSRAIAFGDRIDLTLYDLKKYCGGDMNCKLLKTYRRPNTLKWLESFDSDFEKIINWFGVQGVFVDENYEVFNLEYDDGTTICECSASYSWNWTDNYYDNLKKKIVEFES